MSEELVVRSRLEAIDAASPIIIGLIDNVRRLEQSLKRINRSFDAIGKATSRSWSAFDKQLSDSISQSVKAVAKSTTDYQSSWTRAHDARLRSEQRLHSSIRKLEEDAYRRNISRSVIAPNNRLPSPNMFGASRSRFLPAGAYGAIAGGSAVVGVKSAFKTRMQTDTSETNLRMFGGFTQKEVIGLRKDWADQAGIKYGLTTSKVIDAFTEGMKAGIPKEIGKDFADIILKSGTGLDLDFESTTKLAARTATLAGDLKMVDPKSVYSFMNSVAIANRESAADANEIVEANRRAISALTSSKMSPEDLSAFTAAGISTGIQSGRAGTFMGFIVSELVNARNENGQRGKDLSRASGMLGFGSKSNLSTRMANDPTETIQDILGRLEAMPETKRTQVADLLAMREWRDELLAVSKVRKLIGNILKETKENTNFLDKASAERLASLSGKWKSVVSAFTLWWEKIGGGFEEIFGEIADYFKDLGKSLDADAIKEKVQRFVRGLREGFGLERWRDAMSNMFGGASGGNAEQWSKVGRGIAEGLRFVWNTISGVFTSAAKLFGVETGDPQAMARFVTAAIGFTVALRFLAPAVTVLATIGAGLKTFGYLVMSLKDLFAGGVTGTAFGVLTTLVKGIIPAIVLSIGTAIIDSVVKAGDVVLDRLFPNRQKLDSKRLTDRSIMQKFLDALSSDDEIRQRYGVQKQSYLTDPYEAGRLFHKAAFIDGMRPGQNPLFHQASFGGSAGAFRGGLAVASVPVLGEGSGGGGATGLLNANPGAAIPSIGGRSGAIIRRGGGTNAPSEAVSSVGTGAAGGDVGSLISKGEGGYGSFNRGIAGDSKGKIDFSQMSIAQIMARQSLRPGDPNRLFAVGKYQVIPSTMREAVKSLGLDTNSKFGPEMQENIFRNFLIAGKRPQIKDFIIGKGSSLQAAQLAAAQEFASVAAPRTGRSFYAGSGGNAASISASRVGDALLRERAKYQQYLKEGLSPADAWSKLSGGSSPTANVPKPSEAISNVPSLPSRAGGINPSMIPQNGRGGGGGSSVININGNSHDPEALANLVQRRIDEAYNWRTHDIEYDRN